MRKYLLILVILLGILWWGHLDKKESFDQYVVISLGSEDAKIKEEKEEKEEEEEEEEEEQGGKRDTDLEWKDRRENSGQKPARGKRPTVLSGIGITTETDNSASLEG